MSTESQMSMLHNALTLIRDAVPAACQARLSTSDQGNYGFALTDVLDAQGEPLIVADQLWTDLTDALWPYLANLDWDGVVGEDKHGYATLQIPTDATAQPDE